MDLKIKSQFTDSNLDEWDWVSLKKVSVQWDVSIIGTKVYWPMLFNKQGVFCPLMSWINGSQIQTTQW